jgi:hypothetical protein
LRRILFLAADVVREDFSRRRKGQCREGIKLFLGPWLVLSPTTMRRQVPLFLSAQFIFTEMVGDNTNHGVKISRKDAKGQSREGIELLQKSAGLQYWQFRIEAFLSFIWVVGAIKKPLISERLL